MAAVSLIVVVLGLGGEGGDVTSLRNGLNFLYFVCFNAISGRPVRFEAWSPRCSDQITSTAQFAMFKTIENSPLHCHAKRRMGRRRNHHATTNIKTNNQHKNQHTGNTWLA